ncbi:response regulator transcription factor [Eubacteriaceae bacterium ES2]|nr:response regulator transcription factor [Eubacteriaceae bacterium ES2]
MKRLLIVDDDVHLRKLVLTYARLDEFFCEEASTGQQAVDIHEDNPFDVIILDVMMPGINGFETLKKIREKSDVPIIMLTSRDQEYDKLEGFSLGADDYVPKPFSPKELMARVGAVLKRSRANSSLEKIEFGKMIIFADSRTVTVDNAICSLTPKEFDLLYFLACHEKQVFTREQLLNQIWGYDYFGDIRTVDTHIKSLRARLGGYKKNILTVWGTGYKFEDK